MVPPGKSIAHSEINFPDQQKAACSSSHKNNIPDLEENSSDQERVADGHFSGLDDTDNEFDEVEEMEEEIEFNKKLESGTLGVTTAEKVQNSGLKDVKRVVGEHVIVLYDSQVYPGVITSVELDGALISAMKKSLKFWKWPEKPDEIWYEWDNVIGSINPPKQMSKRGLYVVPEVDKLWWQ